MNQESIFIIRPVRNVTEEVGIKIAKYVATFETRGYTVYDPERDNPFQKTDSVGMKIIKHNRNEMRKADEVHIWYDKESKGSIFDIGMFFIFTMSVFKKFVIINRDEVVPTPGKSFENVILELEKEFDNPVANGLKEKWEKYGK